MCFGWSSKHRAQPATVNMFRVDRRFVLMTNVFNSFVVTCHCVDSDDS
jgi:hypothetical protein